MLFHVAASRQANTSHGLELKALQTSLAEMGHRVRIDHITQPSVPNQLGENDIKDYYSKLRGWIKTSDALIAEITNPSNGVGHEIFMALNENIPVLALYTYSPDRPLDLSVRGNPSKLLTVQRYTRETLSGILKDFTTLVESKKDARFVFTLPNSDDKFLDWLASNANTSKTAIFKEKIAKEIENDSKYQELLK